MAEAQEREVRSYFAYDDETRVFLSSQLRVFAELQKTVVGKYLRPENTQRFRHGGGWSNPANPEAPEVKWHTHSAETAIRFEDIVNNDLSTIDRTFAAFKEAMERQFAEMLYSTVSEAAEQVGNVVDAKAQPSLADAFMATIEKIEFMADKNGEVSLPEVHVHPETGAKMMAALEAAPQEFKDRLEALKARKSEEALTREAERKTKFVRYGPA
ncbi:hypothetical protein [Caulobacter soli]|jgi:hypothetical protein|uniref:hypothetical protein n=1 Tax=Caulobacter soli TaxID=2708539 RepID=UPI0013EB90E1|nr:hypothetical protein [Caulobacter soli]